MRRIFAGVIFVFLFHQLLLAQWSFTGMQNPAYIFHPPTSTGLESVCILNGKAGCEMIFRSDTDSPMICMRYQLSAARSEQTESVQNGNDLRISAPETDYGYYIIQNGRNKGFIWVTDYAGKELVLRSLTMAPDQDACEQVRLLLDYEAPRLSYTDMNGGRHLLDRDLSLAWNTLEWDEENRCFSSITVNETVKAGAELLVDAPFCNTSYTLTGDQFQTFWNTTRSIESDEYAAVAVTGRAQARGTSTGDGEESSSAVSLGGSAPLEVYFSSYTPREVVTYKAWEFSRDPGFENIHASYTEEALNYSFQEPGKMYVRFVISNAENSCEKVVDSYVIDVSESNLEVPNVFAPDGTSERNKQFKVTYKSILRFDGRIFNRWGNEIFHWTDPSVGWDGTYKGKPVPSGTYYYVIRAQGNSGESMNRKGDLNLLRTRSVE